MALKNQLGINFGLKGLSIAEIESQKLINYYHIPYSAVWPSESGSGLENIPDEIKLTALLQRTLREKKIEIKEAFISFPTKDIILRSFNLPGMSKDELPSAIELEVRKYLPFKLDDLIFDYQISKITEAKSKKVRVLFVAVKKNILYKYIYILEQSELIINSLEFNSLCLLRVLLFKKILTQHQSVVIVESDFEDGNIIAIERGLPHLIRDFKLASTTSNAFVQDSMGIYNKLLNEIRVSLDYHRRQYPKSLIDRILFCSNVESGDWANSLARELGIPIIFLRPQELLSAKETLDIGLIMAFGAALKNTFNLPTTIDINKKRSISESKLIKQALAEPLPFNAIMGAILVAIVIIAFAFLINIRGVLTLSRNLTSLTPQKSQYSSMTIEELRRIKDVFQEKISILTQARSSLLPSPKLILISKLLTDGMWLTDLSIKSSLGETSPSTKRIDKTLSINSMSIKGRVYLKDSSDEITAVNKFVLNLKKEIDIAKEFNSINLISATQSQIGEYLVTDFLVECR